MTRLLRVELRRNAMLVLLPVVALLWLGSPIARHLVPMALWPDRSTDIQSALMPLCPFSAGVAAWMAGRERRRGASDLLATTPRHPALRTVAVLAATTVWSVLGYLAGVTTMLVITSYQATWGHPSVWPLLVGLLAVLAASAAGFAVGRVAPSRFTAPLVAIGMLGLLALGAQLAFTGSRYAVIGPLYPTINLNLSVFFPIRADLAVLQLLGAGGVLLAALAVTVLHAGNRRLGLAGVGVGVLLLGLSVGLVGTAHRDQQRAVVVPALDQVATQQPLAYTPVCGRGVLEVCVHPAYAAKLSVVMAVVNKLAAPLAATPGLPVRAEQEPIDSTLAMTVHDGRLVLPPLFIQGDTLGPNQIAGTYDTGVALELVNAPGRNSLQATKAQQALATYLLRQAGDVINTHLLLPDPAVTAAAGRLAAQSASARHAWLVAHIAGVRAGTVTLMELP